jgi:hypothetical protein
MIKFSIDTYSFLVHIGEKPEKFNNWTERSSFADLDGLSDSGKPIYIGIEEANKWEMMIVAFNTEPIDETFFHPQILFITETTTLFVGAGRRAMTFSLKKRIKIADRRLAFGFWYWAKHNNFIVLREELEIAVYDYDGHFIWATRTEPPWSYGIEGNTLTLDIMNNITRYKLNTGDPIY